MKNKISNLIQKIDLYIFDQVDTLKSSPSYIKFSEQISSLDDDLRKVVSKITLLILIGIPFIIICLVWASNSSVREQVEIKKRSYEVSKSIIEGKKNLSSFGGGIISGTGINDANQMGTKMRSVLAQSKIDTKNIQVTQFITNSSIPSIIRSEAKLIFKNLGLKALTDLINNLTNNHNFKINETSIKRNDKDASLNGHLHIIHFGRVK